MSHDRTLISITIFSLLPQILHKYNSGYQLPNYLSPIINSVLKKKTIPSMVAVFIHLNNLLCSCKKLMDPITHHLDLGCQNLLSELASRSYNVFKVSLFGLLA